MRKKYSRLILILVLISLAAGFTPALLHAEDDTLDEKGPNFVEKILQPLISISPGFKLFWPWLAGAVILSALIKVWLIRRKMALPGRFQVMDKLVSAGISEVMAELFFLVVIILIFAPALLDKFTQFGWFMTAADPLKGQPLRLIALIVFSLPYVALAGAAMTLLVIHLLTHKPASELRSMLRFSVMISPLFPAVLCLTVWIAQFFLKLPVETPPAS